MMSKISKHPVIAPSGEKYKVVVYESSHYDDKDILHPDWMIYLYAKRGLVWKQISQPIRYPQDEYSLIDAARDIVTRYDPEYKRTKEDKKKFINWDGDMRMEKNNFDFSS